MNNAEFKEITRVRISDSVEVIFSEVHRDGKLTGYTLNKYITTEQYTGFTKGIFIPDDMLTDFLKLFPKDELQLALG